MRKLWVAAKAGIMVMLLAACAVIALALWEHITDRWADWRS